MELTLTNDLKQENQLSFLTNPNQEILTIAIGNNFNSNSEYKSVFIKKSDIQEIIDFLEKCK